MKLPVLILAGSLGAGKTTFLNQLRHRSATLRRYQTQGTLLLIINDFAEENVDAAMVSRQSDDEAMTTSTQPLDLPPTQHVLLPSVVPISGGCVCCNKLPTLVRTLITAATMDSPSVSTGMRWEYVILECTGLADTAPVVAAMLTHPALKELVEVDAVVAVVDASSYSIETDPLKGSQLVGANVVVLSKTDLVAQSPATSSLPLTAWAEASKNSDVIVLLSMHGYVALPPTEWSADEHLVLRYLFREQHESREWFLSVAASFANRTDAEREHEEALERERLGLSTLCFRVWEVPPTTATEHDDAVVDNVSRKVGDGVTIDIAIPDASTLRISSMLPHVAGILKGGLRGRKHPAVVWRSKGFFTAMDDEAVKVEMGTEELAGPHIANEKQQFTWNSQGKQFDYAPITPPHVTLPLNRSNADPFHEVKGNIDVSLCCCVVELVLIGTMDVDVTAALLRAAFHP